MHPSVSVVVPAHNVAGFIERCLESLAQQTLQSIEIIVINDGSTDATQSVIDEYVERYPDRFRMLQTAGIGPGAVRNLGIAEARGEYVGFVDADDSAKRQMFELLYDKATETDADIVVCGYVAVDAATGDRTYHRQGWARDYGKSLRERPGYLLSVSAYVWNKLFRRQMLVESGLRFPEGVLFEDIPFMFCSLARANRIAKVQKGLYNYTRRRPGAITHSYRPENLQILETLSATNEYYQANGEFEDFEQQLLMVNFKHLFNRFVELPNYNDLRTKLRLVAGIMEHMDRYFPGWRTARQIQCAYSRQWRFRVFMNPVSRRVYASTPASVHATLDSLHRLRVGFKAFIGRFGPRRRALLRYARNLRRPIAADVALFEAFHGKGITDMPFYLLRDLARRGTHKCYVAVRDVQAAKDYLRLYDVDATPVKAYSARYTRLLATAGYLVNNVSFPPYFVKRPGQVYLNTWHGVPLKTLGKSMPYGLKDLPNLQRNFFKADRLLFTNEYTRDVMMQDYMLAGPRPDLPMLNGSPRNEALLDDARARELRSLLGLEGRHVYLYMPTWRGGNSRAVDAPSFERLCEVHFAALDQALPDDAVMLVKLHHLTASGIDFDEYERIQLAPTTFETYDLLSVADTLITDYSSVMFDFAVTRREILLFTFDLDEYLEDRRLYLPMSELPFPAFCSVEELAAHVAGCHSFTPDEGYGRFVERFVPLDRPGVATEINDEMLASPRPKAEKPEMDLVFLPYLKKKGQARLERLLSEGYDRSDVLFVFSTRKYYAQANEYLFRRYKTDGLDINYAVSGDRMVLGFRQSIALWLFRWFGWFESTVDDVYRIETQRILGDVRVRSAHDFSGYRKYSEMAASLNRLERRP